MQFQESAIIGNGKVGQFFLNLFQEHDLTPDCYARNPHSQQRYLGDFPKVHNYRLILLAVSDDAIHEVSQALPAAKEALIAHCSGVHQLDTLAQHHPRRGVLYPLMSISADRTLERTKIPFCVEAEHDSDSQFLRELVLHLGGRYFRLEGTQRPYLHLAAVLAQNFTNHLYTLAYDVLKKQNIPFELLLPLLKNHVARLEHQVPASAQTGPALRRDQATLERHLALLDDPLTREIYQKITQSIQAKHEK